MAHVKAGQQIRQLTNDPVGCRLLLIRKFLSPLTNLDQL